MADDGVHNPGQVFSPPEELQKTAHCSSMEQYKEMYQRSLDDPAAFWGEIGREFYWKSSPNADKFLEYNFDPNKGPVSIKWMQGGLTNVCYNVLDRNVNDKGLADAISINR